MGDNNVKYYLNPISYDILRIAIINTKINLLFERRRYERNFQEYLYG